MQACWDIINIDEQLVITWESIECVRSDMQDYSKYPRDGSFSSRENAASGACTISEKGDRRITNSKEDVINVANLNIRKQIVGKV